MVKKVIASAAMVAALMGGANVGVANADRGTGSGARQDTSRTSGPIKPNPTGSFCDQIRAIWNSFKPGPVTNRRGTGSFGNGYSGPVVPLP